MGLDSENMNNNKKKKERNQTINKIKLINHIWITLIQI